MNKQVDKKISLEENGQDFDEAFLGQVDSNISQEEKLFITDPTTTMKIFPKEQLLSPTSFPIEEILLIKPKSCSSRAYKTSINYKILIDSILKDFKGNAKTLVKQLKTEYNISEKSYVIIFLLLLEVYPQEKQTETNHLNLMKNIKETWTLYEQNKNKPEDFLLFLKMEIQRLEKAIYFFFQGKIDQAIDACYQATEKEGNNKGNSANFRKKCHQKVDNYCKKK